MKQELNENVERSMASLDDVHQAEVKPFFYSRLQGRFVKERQTMQLQRKFAWVTLATVLLVNTLVYSFYEPTEQINADDAVTLMSEQYSFYQDDLFNEITE